MPFKMPHLNDFGMLPTSGFLPSSPPLPKFSSPYYRELDSLISQLSSLITTHDLNNEIQNLPILRTTQLTSEAEIRRAYVILAFLIYAYIRSNLQDGTPVETIPPQLSDPFLAVCEELGMKAVLSYAGLCLWNWVPKPSTNLENGHGFYEIEQINPIASFTGSRGEAAFYHVPILIEAEGGPLIQLLLDAVSATQKGEVIIVTQVLERCAKTFVKMGAHLAKLYPLLDAEMFFHKLRPILSPGQGVFFQKSDGTRIEMKGIGGSAAQSSLFQFLDLVLGVEHGNMDGEKVSVFEEMRKYMPGKHRDFLTLVSELPDLRSFLHEHQGNANLVLAYENCMKQLRLWRGKHIAVVSKYIVQPARFASRGGDDVVNGDDEELEVDKGEDLKGTGGSALIPFLRKTKEETVGLRLP